MWKELLKYHRMPLLFLFSCCALYLAFAFDLERSDFPKLLGLYLALCFLSWKLFRMETYNLKFLGIAALLFRLLFLFSIPNLSQDFYRFLWDGHLHLKGINPYLFRPQELLPPEGFQQPYFGELISGMGSLSAGNHSNYPPLSQLIFALAAFIGGKSILGGIVVFRLVLMASELGIFYFGRRLLKAFNLPENRIFWFLLNPFVIIELTGNLHFEGLMIFFLLWSFYLLQKGNWMWSAIVFALAVDVKLIPFLFLPLFFQVLTRGSERRGKWDRILGYYAIVGIVFLLGFLPFLESGFLNNYSTTIGLWFQKFEFNASIYYLIRWIGFELQGYNIIGIAGLALALTILFWVLFLTFFRNNREPQALMVSMLLAISFYYFMSTTVHPWYLALPLILCIFTPYRFPFVWSVAVILSYFAYSHPYLEENFWLVGLEYLLVFSFLIWEWKSKRRIGAIQRGFP